MFKLYFADKLILIDTGISPDTNGEVLRVNDLSIIERTKLLQKLHNTKKLYLITDDPQKVYDHVLGQFRTIEAAGGLTLNSRDEILMIFRHNRWDLPKGKLEECEKIEACAVREVSEECGIREPELGKFLTFTTHFYQLHGEWVVKKTSWYRMLYLGDETPVPQLEEDITAIEWVNPGKLDHYLRNTYSTIVDVFESAGYFVR